MALFAKGTGHLWRALQRSDRSSAVAAGAACEGGPAKNKGGVVNRASGGFADVAPRVALMEFGQG